MNKDMIELYSDYLIASFGQTTATGLANLLQGSIYHDSITRFLNSETLAAKEQWQLIKPMLRQHENPHCQNSCHPHPNNLNGGKGDNHGTIQCRTQTSNIKQTAIA